MFFTFPVIERTLLPLYLFLYITCLLFRFKNFRNMFTFARPTCKKVKKVTKLVKITQKYLNQSWLSRNQRYKDFVSCDTKSFPKEVKKYKNHWQVDFSWECLNRTKILFKKLSIDFAFCACVTSDQDGGNDHEELRCVRVGGGQSAFHLF